MDPKIEQYVRMGFELSYADPSLEAGIPPEEPWRTYYSCLAGAGNGSVIGAAVVERVIRR
jgi:hypothetical protein